MKNSIKQNDFVYEKIDNLFNEVIFKIKAINTRLKEIESRIKEIQPASDGSLILRLHNCSTNCIGCPHIRWEQWRWREHKKPHWVGHIIKERPHLRIKSTGSFEQSHKEMKILMDEVKSLQKERSAIVKHLANLSRSMIYSNIHEDDEDAE